MQRSLRKQYPGAITSSTSSSYITAASQIFTQSSLLLQAVGASPCMASSQNWSVPEERRRHPFSQTSQIRHPTLSQHSSPTISPLSPTYVLRSPPTEHVRRRDTRTYSSLRHRQRESNSYSETQQTFIPYTPNYQTEPAARSAPSLVTSFPLERPRSSLNPTASRPAVSPSPSRYNQYHSYSNPLTLFSPVGSNPYDAWQESPQRARPQSYMASPTSYGGPQWTDPLPEFYQQEGRGYSASSAPGALQSPAVPNGAGMRRESEVADDFTSPSEFALFAEATSSLNIEAATFSSSPWAYTPRPAPTPSRLAAPLPPLPRSHSSPAPSSRFPARQPSRTQLLAEAMVGLEREGSGPGSSSSDDELPDYAQSQAEAHARQRREAARRAQELEQSWSNARRRRG